MGGRVASVISWALLAAGCLAEGKPEPSGQMHESASAGDPVGQAPSADMPAAPDAGTDGESAAEAAAPADASPGAATDGSPVPEPPPSGGPSPDAAPSAACELPRGFDQVQFSGSVVWQKRFGAVGWQEGRGAAADAEGNVILLGLNVFGSFDLSVPGAPVFGQSGGVLVKTSQRGELLWTRSFAGLHVHHVAVDTAGNIAFSAVIFQEVMIGDTRLAPQTVGGAALAVVTLAPDGTLRWARQVWDVVPWIDNDPRMTTIATASDGDVYVTARSLLARLEAATGERILDRELATPPSPEPASSWMDVLDTAVAPDGTLFVGLRYAGDWRLPGGAPFARNGAEEPRGFAVAHLTADGDPLWVKSYASVASPGGAMLDELGGVAADQQGHFFFSASSNQALDFGGGPVMPDSPSGFRMIFVGLRENGEHLWSRGVDGGAFLPMSDRLEADVAGNVVAVGRIRGSINFHTGQHTPGADSDLGALFVVKFNPCGAPLWTKEMSGGFGPHVGLGMHPKGLMVTGGFNGRARFPGGPMSSYGSPDNPTTDMFVVKLTK